MHTDQMDRTNGKKDHLQASVDGPMPQNSAKKSVFRQCLELSGPVLPDKLPVLIAAVAVRFLSLNSVVFAKPCLKSFTMRRNTFGENMSVNSLVQELIDAGVHFGHRASRWNPKMRPYIYGRKNQIHIIDIRETVRGLLRAKKFISEVASDGSLVLFVGTKRQASAAVAREAERCNMPYVSERWLGGALTNFSTIRSRMGRLEELEEIRGGEKIAEYSKKAQSSLNREYRKIYRNLNGIRTMNRKPGCMIIVDPKKEKNAILEARSLGITTIALIDTNCDPDMVDLPIPGNDDGIRAVEVIMSHMADAVIAGAKNVVAKNEGKDAKGGKKKPPAPKAAPAAKAAAPAATPAAETPAPAVAEAPKTEG